MDIDSYVGVGVDTVGMDNFVVSAPATVPTLSGSYLVSLALLLLGIAAAAVFRSGNLVSTQP